MTGSETDGIASRPGLTGYVVAVGLSWLLMSLGIGGVAVSQELRFDAQWIHVLVSGPVGAGSVAVAGLLLGGALVDFWMRALGVGLCTALGRAAVIPLVPVVRQRRGAVQPPVDGDFRDRRTAC